MCEICPKVLRKVYVIFQDLSRRTHKGPYGPIYGPIRAHMGPILDRVELPLFLTVVLYFAGPDLVSYIKELILMEKTYFLKFLDAKPCIIIWQLYQKSF